MGRVKIKFPDDNPIYTAIVPVRITDINYGGHLGNDKVLTIIHEARIQMLDSWGYTELEAGGNSLIMADVMIAYKAEAFYGDTLDIAIYTDELTDRSFDLLYKITTIRNEKYINIAHAKTGMITFDYTDKKITQIKDELKNRLINMDF
jgi:acyl-CoA thioesterase FadM